MLVKGSTILVVSLAIATVAASQCGDDPRGKDANGTLASSHIDISSTVSLYPRNDRGATYDPPSMDERHQESVTRALLLYLAAQSSDVQQLQSHDSEPSRALSPEFTGISEIVCSSEFTWDCSWALAVIQCESGGHPDSQGVEWYNGKLYHFNGWWQIAEGPFDPYLNTVEAHIQYVQWQKGLRGRPWPNCP